MSDDENPYASPHSARDDVCRAQKPLPRDAVWFCLRFAAALALMAIANVVPLYFSWKAYQLDGREVTGWPFVFREQDGGAYGFYLDYLAADVAIAIGVAYAVAHALRDGWLTFLRRLRTAVIDDVD